MLLSDVCSVAPAYLTMMSQCTDTPLSTFLHHSRKVGTNIFNWDFRDTFCVAVLLLVLLARTLLAKWFSVMQKKAKRIHCLSCEHEHLQGKAHTRCTVGNKLFTQQQKRKKTSNTYPSSSCLCVSIWLKGLSFCRNDCSNSAVFDCHPGPSPAHYTALLTPTYGPEDPPPTFSDSCMRECVTCVQSQRIVFQNMHKASFFNLVNGVSCF